MQRYPRRNLISKGALQKMWPKGGNLIKRLQLGKARLGRRQLWKQTVCRFSQNLIFTKTLHCKSRSIMVPHSKDNIILSTTIEDRTIHQKNLNAMNDPGWGVGAGLGCHHPPAPGHSGFSSETQLKKYKNCQGTDRDWLKSTLSEVFFDYLGQLLLGWLTINTRQKNSTLLDQWN